jgi:hypothetical protein
VINFLITPFLDEEEERVLKMLKRKSLLANLVGCKHITKYPFCRDFFFGHGINRVETCAGNDKVKVKSSP